LKDGSQQGADGAFAIGAGHLHRRVALLGVACISQGGLQALKAQINATAAKGLE
jgi:hypothetical protein